MNGNAEVEFPVPVVPITTWCERILGYGILAISPGRCPTALMTAPATTAPFRLVNGTEPGAVLLALAVRT